MPVKTPQKRELRDSTAGLTDPSHAIGLVVMDSNPAPIPASNISSAQSSMKKGQWRNQRRLFTNQCHRIQL